MTESENRQQSNGGSTYRRVLGLDYGSKTVGVAVSDPLRLTAQGVEIIRRKSENKLRQTLARITELASEYQAETIVLGFPRNMNATIGERARATIEFKAMVERRTQLPVILWDERLTTVAADRVMDETGVRNHKDYVDEIAAMLILQGYLDRVNAGLPVPEVKIDEE
ncbi:MAG: Holliday junction resolvase RuvX [Lachnospiraceae bacterium]|nr:Holliday junction resolvase RuvX [Lachnospiraceae bacterium]